MTYRTGLGTDVHPLVAGRPLVLGGHSVPFEMGLDGHSDGDVLVHAVIDALLGAAALGDIGTHFSSSDPGNAGISSIVLLKRTVEKVRNAGWLATFVDATIVAQRPKLTEQITAMRSAIAAAIGIDASSVNIKATTEDGMGFTGTGDGIAALAVAAITELRE